MAGEWQVESEVDKNMKNCLFILLIITFTLITCKAFSKQEYYMNKNFHLAPDSSVKGSVDTVSYTIHDFEQDCGLNSIMLIIEWATDDGEWATALSASLTGSILKAIEDGAKLSSLTIKFIPKKTSQKLSQVLPDTDWVRIISNLLINSFHAMSGRSNQEIIIKIGCMDDLDYFSISDTGCGIADKDIERIYDRSFSKKPDGIAGTGQGMQLVKEIVDSCNGFISIESELEKGTTITLSFIANMGFEEGFSVSETSL